MVGQHAKQLKAIILFPFNQTNLWHDYHGVPVQWRVSWVGNWDETKDTGRRYMQRGWEKMVKKKNTGPFMTSNETEQATLLSSGHHVCPRYSAAREWCSFLAALGLACGQRSPLWNPQCSQRWWSGWLMMWYSGAYYFLIKWSIWNLLLVISVVGNVAE